MNHHQLRQLETTTRALVAARLVAAVRAAPAHRQADELARRMQALDAPGRQAVYPLLSDAELDLLLPGLGRYVAGLSDAELRAIAADPKATRLALRTIQRQQREATS
jgi:hypothetical protein